MWQSDFQLIEEMIEQNPDIADFDGPVPDGDILHAQDILGFQFPAAYQKFSRTFGVGNFGAAEFYGLIAGNVPAQSIPCAVFATLSERADPNFPSDFLVIQATGYGPMLCLAIGEMSDGDCPVREWNYNPVTRDAETLVSPTFSGHMKRW